ncbi:hypothetical protein H2200_011901 [Cladophialophora chaetospira]|uniref:Major facilitator superfamily (MFS) profile domain-containing protein n=1 Tax=Cladophialophora chaetospira TaxID=386627 RepID=A0AA38WYY7_9EURO|nr:hypothetical protein H2200_011901 [Cladophialophora chaetospira]
MASDAETLKHGTAMGVEHVHEGLPADFVDDEKRLPTVYIAQDGGSHNKSKEERAVVLKADLVIIPLCALLYFVAYLDRNSIGNARVLGMQADLGLTSHQFYNILSLFFIGYLVFILPGNLLLRLLTPPIVLGGTALAFGAILIGMSGAQNYSTVLALRILLGSAQAFMQGLSLYSSLWYKRDEIATRGALIYWAATISGAFSGLIAYGVGKNLTLERTGKEPWRWLFIIEGALAMVVGLAIVLLLPPFPDKIKAKHWLFKPAEIEIAKARSASYNTTESKIIYKQVWKTLQEPKSWGFAVMNAGIGYGISSVGQFLPTFIHALGLSVLRTQLFSVIPYACAGTTIFIAIISDRFNKKGIFLVGTLSWTCIGYAILLSNVSVASKIVAACIATSGLYPSIILLNSWLLANSAGYTKRATVWAMAEVFGPAFSILSSHVYDTPPRFVKGHSIALGL